MIGVFGRLSARFHWVIPASLRSDAVSHGRARNLVGFAGIAVVFGPPIAAVYGRLSGPLSAAAILLAVLGILVSMLSMPLTQRLTVGAWGSVASIYAVFVYMAWVAGGSPAQATLEWFALVPVIASFVGGLRHGVIWALAAVLGVLGFSAASALNVPFPAPMREPQLLSTTMNVAFVAVMGTVATLFQMAKEQVESQLESLALQDTLTGLPNRRKLMLQLQGALARSRRTRLAVAVLFLDLDGFKGINDTLGHAVGDEVLKVFAQRLRGCLREIDTVARLAGDEFVIVLEGLHHRHEAAKVARQILAHVAAPLELSSAAAPVPVSTSIGIAYQDDGQQRVEPLLSAADKALYASKSAGRGGFSFAA